MAVETNIFLLYIFSWSEKVTRLHLITSLQSSDSIFTLFIFSWKVHSRILIKKKSSSYKSMCVCVGIHVCIKYNWCTSYPGFILKSEGVFIIF